MRRAERPLEGWYYKQDGQAFGPLPTGQLKELLAAGRLQPRQAVWQRGSDGCLRDDGPLVPAVAVRACPGRKAWFVNACPHNP